jgi:hypothetical protein
MSDIPTNDSFAGFLYVTGDISDVNISVLYSMEA